MAQIIDPLPSSDPDAASESELCCYVNATSKIQIARITNVPDWYFERVVFPGQRLMFEAVATALLEIHTGMMASSILSDTIPCQRLVMDSDPLPSDSLFLGAPVDEDVSNSAPVPKGASGSSATTTQPVPAVG